MKAPVKNVVCILVLMNTINLISQKRKQEIVYEEPLRFIESPLAIGKAETSQAAMSQIDKVDIALKEIIKKNGIIGLQLAIVKKGRIIKTMNYGLASVQDSVLVDSKTVFSINSMTKAFTGVALMQLVENGKISLEDPISKYLDSLPNDWKNISIK